MDAIKNLYHREEMTVKEIRKIIRKAKRGTYRGTCWFLVQREDSKNLLEIVATDELRRMRKRRNKMMILGLAKEEEEARLLVRDLIDDVYKATSTVDINAYFNLNYS